MSGILALLIVAEIGRASRLPKIIGFVEVKAYIASDNIIFHGQICADAARPLYCSRLVGFGILIA